MFLRRLGAFGLTIIETVLIYAGIPALVIAVIVGLVFASDMRRGDKRYRPGRPFEFRPVWFLSAPEHVAGQESLDHKALRAADVPAALAAGRARTQGDWPASEQAQQSVTGGASDSW
jgi:hypothetical protein